MENASVLTYMVAEHTPFYINYHSTCIVASIIINQERVVSSTVYIFLKASLKVLFHDKVEHHFCFIINKENAG